MLGDQLKAYAASSSDPNAASLAESESAARRELASTRAQLAVFQAQLGPEATPDARDLATKLVERDGKLKELEAQLKAQEHSTDMLYAEIDRLSTAWATLDEQNSSKVFNLQHLEEKAGKLLGEKAKADNRYFATMRQKDALAAENTVLTKLAEKQQRVVDAAKEMQHSLGDQLTSAEKEITAHQHTARAYQNELEQSRREAAELKLRHDHHSRRIAELNELLAQRVGDAEANSAARLKAEEQLGKAERELKAAKAAVAASSSAGGSSANDSGDVKELKRHNQDLTKMLKCSCGINFKNRILTRVSSPVRFGQAEWRVADHSHPSSLVRSPALLTMRKPLSRNSGQQHDSNGLPTASCSSSQIEARLANRSRKCPNCGVRE